ncbi:single-stranded DNA-binding protein [Anaerococcus hydrogenalis]|uniref:Single-stranded DNA-binding protein n=1 Tax=Anaerococcus hydrogenalis ACS-025-V-Sch4 TaxID=879306 RepID=F0H2E9_9FIRM|nr:single-stranded DNA-binding protein [Anaerococcus hydrogenalis]EGC83368.1 single-strand binding family protein [Anaerococcus hydrogenalis ACS-025-V-Sch4]
MNKVILIGRLTKDPELRYTQSGMAVCQFTLAVNKNLSKDKKEEMEAQNKATADFPRIIVWGKMGENASGYLKKGSQCAIDGAIQTGSYQDNNGNRVFTTDIVAQRVEFLSKSTQDGAEYNSNTNTKQGYQNRSKSNYGTNNDDFFDDDFQEVQDEGRIPF